MLDVIRMHRDAIRGSSRTMCAGAISGAQESGTPRCSTAKNSATRIAGDRACATGTIGFMMDCDTTGSSRTWRWVKHKQTCRRRLDQDREQHRAGSVAEAGYTPEQSSEIVRHIDKQGTVEARRT